MKTLQNFLKHPSAQAAGTVFLLFYLLSLTDFFDTALFYQSYLMSITMAFGSFIAGSTCAGGGAVAFPVMTLIFKMSPSIARDFSLMIQSIGMTSALFVILRTHTKVDKTAIFYATLGGITALPIGFEFICPLISPDMTRVFFISLWFSFSCVLLLTYCKKNDTQQDETSRHIPWTRSILFCSGFIGGLMTSIAGSGIDIFVFSTLCLLFSIHERVATPTSVIIMALTSIAGTAYRFFFPELGGIGPIAAITWQHWFFCICVVAVGAPMGALFIKNKSRLIIVGFIFSAIVAQFLLGFFVVLLNNPHMRALIFFGLSVFIIGLCIFILKYIVGMRFLKKILSKNEL